MLRLNLIRAGGEASCGGGAAPCARGCDRPSSPLQRPAAPDRVGKDPDPREHARLAERGTRDPSPPWGSIRTITDPAPWARMHRYRVTKYDPALRTTAGAYGNDDWTSFRDVGRSFDGVKLSHDEYLRVESAYVDAASAFLAEDRAPELRVVGLECVHRPGALVEGAVVARADFASVCRAVLREEFWCKLEADDRFVHFGWDYYMYVGVMNPCDGSISRAEALGLFVEDFESPYSSR